MARRSPFLSCGHAVLVASTFLSVACTWAYTKKYDISETTYSVAAAILTSIALCGSTFGFCGCGNGGSETKMGMGLLSKCFEVCDDENNVICVCCRCLAACILGLIISLSFGTLQIISGGLMVQSLVINTATNVKVFAGFIAAFDFLAVICGFFSGCILCCSCMN